jgi:hypothetical protein
VTLPVEVFRLSTDFWHTAIEGEGRRYDPRPWNLKMRYQWIAYAPNTIHQNEDSSVTPHKSVLGDFSAKEI